MKEEFNKSKGKIFNSHVKMQSQEQCNRMKNLCIDNGLPIFRCKSSFIYDEEFGNSFYYTLDPESNKYAFVVLFASEHKNEITEKEFIEILKNK
jgi:hypothetical protein